MDRSGKRLRRGGVLRPRLFLVLLFGIALLSPILYFPRVVAKFTVAIPCGRPEGRCGFGDPVTAASVLGRAWWRWETGRPFNVDERVFPPYPNAWALSDGYPIEAAIGWPFARLLGSVAAGYNVPFALGCVLATVGAGLLLSRLAGRGWPALLGSLLYAWGPARLNNLGVLDTVWAGIVPLGLFFALRYFDRGRKRDAFLWAVVWFALGLGGLYGLFLGSLTAGLFLALTVLPVRERRRRLPLLGGLGLAVALALAWLYRPLFRLAEDFDARVAIQVMEGHAADVLSLAHHGVFSGPLGNLLEHLVPGFPEGASALFPTLTLLFALALAPFGLATFAPAPRGRRRPERDARVWLFLAFLAFLCALGPTIRFAGRPLAPGPWRLVAVLPVFSSLRGLHRWDQWFDLAVVAAATLLLGRALRRSGSRVLLVAAALLVAVDVWPRPVPAIELPPPSPFDDVLRSLPEDAVVGDFPYNGEVANRSWIEQLSHGRRLLIGIQSFAPPIHFWLERRCRTHGVADAIAVYRELGISAFQARLGELSPDDRRALLEIASRPEGAGARRSVLRGDAVLLLFEPTAPVLIDPRHLVGLVFDGSRAEIPGALNRLVFRLGRSETPVLVRSAAREESAALAISVAGVSGLPARLSGDPPRGATVFDARTGREIGRVK
jgi:hypothetical protein